MRIGVIQATSQKNKNNLLYECTVRAVQNQCFEVVDFIVTGCSSGQGMMLACNSLISVYGTSHIEIDNFDIGYPY